MDGIPSRHFLNFLFAQTQLARHWHSQYSITNKNFNTLCNWLIECQPDQTDELGRVGYQPCHQLSVQTAEADSLQLCLSLSLHGFLDKWHGLYQLL